MVLHENPTIVLGFAEIPTESQSLNENSVPNSRARKRHKPLHVDNKRTDANSNKITVGELVKIYNHIVSKKHLVHEIAPCPPIGSGPYRTESLYNGKNENEYKAL